MRCKGEFCGLCYEFAKGRSDGHMRGKCRKRIHYGDNAMAEFLRRRESNSPNGVNGVHLDGGGWAKKYPALWEFLTCEEWQPGVPRTVGTLLLFLDGGLLKACLNDRDGGCVTFVTDESPESLLAALEKGLRAGNLDWRVSKPLAGKKKA